MISFSRRRLIAALGLALLAAVGLRAESFTGNTYIDFNARGYAVYNMWFAAEVNGTSGYAYANVRFGNIYASSSTYYWGKAGAIVFLNNVRKVGGQWVAESVTIQEISNSTGTYQNRYLSNFGLPGSDWVSGYAQGTSTSQPVRGYIEGSGPVNNPPVPSVSVPGYSNGATVALNTTVSVNFSATDADSNLSGIRYNVWNDTSGFYDNNGGSFVAQSGASGAVTRSITLSTTGTWYFWTEAQDTAGASASTPAWGSGFRLVVPTVAWCTPAYEPTYWNSNSVICLNNNCYNYANHKRTDTMAQPGRGGGYTMTSVDASQVNAGAIYDGLEPTTATAISPEGKTKIALAIWPGQDFHWYRQDSDGRWSGKIGHSYASNLDNSGNPITNPETADRGGYTQFVGYYFTPSDCIQGQGHANIR